MACAALLPEPRDLALRGVCIFSHVVAAVPVRRRAGRPKAGPAVGHSGVTTRAAPPPCWCWCWVLVLVRAGGNPRESQDERRAVS